MNGYEHCSAEVPHNPSTEIAALKGENQLLRCINNALVQELEATRNQIGPADQSFGAARQAASDRLSAIQHLIMAAEFKDHDTGAHLVRTGYFAARLSPMCGCDAEYAGQIFVASTMHDVGKIWIPACILKKRGALDREERQIMQRHAEYGAMLLSGLDIPVLEVAAQIAHCHHEHFDGTGYPRGLKGDQIPLSGRIVAVIDVFDALVMDRAYRRAMPVENALQMIRTGRGKKFDPDVVDAFLSVADEILVLCDHINDDKSLAGLQWPGCETTLQPFAFYDRPLRSLPYTDTALASWTEGAPPATLHDVN